MHEKPVLSVDCTLISKGQGVLASVASWLERHGGVGFDSKSRAHTWFAGSIPIPVWGGVGGVATNRCVMSREGGREREKQGGREGRERTEEGTEGGKKGELSFLSPRRGT